MQITDYPRTIERKIYSNKVVNKMKLALITQCNIQCHYCFVNFTGETMAYETAVKAVNILLESDGEEKILALYGGEPTMVIDLVQKIVAYARQRESALNKKLTITMSTNAIVITEKIAKILRGCGIKLFISMFGKKEHHDAERKVKDGSGKGTYDIVLNSLKSIKKHYDSDNCHCSWCITPDSVSFMEDYPKMKEMGFTYFNIEMIREHKPWHKSHIENFRHEYIGFIKNMMKSIEQGDFFYINPICWEIKYRTISRRKGCYCPFEWHFESYPDGRVAFSPFVLNNKLKEETHVIGNIRDDIAYKYKDCTFDQKSEQCNKCASEYWIDAPEDKGANSLRVVHDMITVQAANLIEKKALVDFKYKEYIDIIKHRMCY